MIPLMQPISIGTGISKSFSLPSKKLTLICGPCAIESRDSALFHAEAISKITERLDINFVYKSSYDKANRTSVSAFRGVGMDEGLQILSEIRDNFGVPIISDVHTAEGCKISGEVLDIVQIPAFLCRQTDLLIAAGETQKVVMIKKGQFLHPLDMEYCAQKVRSTGNNSVLLCERGTCFGYRELVVDFRGLEWMSKIAPVIFDGTHSVQIIGGAGGSSSGNRQFVAGLLRAAVATGVTGVFIESHQNPEKALSDGPNMIALDDLEALLRDLVAIHSLQLSTRKAA